MNKYIVGRLVHWFYTTGYECTEDDFNDEDFRNHYLSDFKFDSLDTVDFVDRIETDLNISIDMDKLDYSCIGGFVDTLAKQLGEIK
jgi:acyl carrier protein